MTPQCGFHCHFVLHPGYPRGGATLHRSLFTAEVTDTEVLMLPSEAVGTYPFYFLYRHFQVSKDVKASASFHFSLVKGLHTVYIMQVT